MEWTGEIMGAVAVGLLGANAAAYRAGRAERSGPLLSSALLALTWAGSTLAVGIWGKAGAVAFPLIDLVGGGLAFLLWRSRPSLWRAALFGLFLLMDGAHVAYHVAALGIADFRAYAVLLNGLFALQLLIAGGPGLRYVGSRLIDVVAGHPPAIRSTHRVFGRYRRRPGGGVTGCGRNATHGGFGNGSIPGA
jgi:hypothetical protein